MEDRIGERPVKFFSHGASLERSDTLVREEALELFVNGRHVVTLMRTPGDDRELAAGFCFTSGIVRSAREIESIEVKRVPAGAGSPEDFVGMKVVNARRDAARDDMGGTKEGSEHTSARSAFPAAGGSQRSRCLVTVSVPGVDKLLSALESRVGWTSGHGIGGSEEALAPPPGRPGARFKASLLERLPHELRKGQCIFSVTGGTHGAGVFSSDGEMLVVMEDAGRHNAFDKAIGSIFLEGWKFSDKGAILSGRLSVEMVAKARAAGLPLVCSVSAPTDLACALAEASGITLVGFLRGARFNVYTHSQRIE